VNEDGHILEYLDYRQEHLLVFSFCDCLEPHPCFPFVQFTLGMIKSMQTCGAVFRYNPVSLDQSLVDCHVEKISQQVRVMSL
jgi:hypothetical protein